METFAIIPSEKFEQLIQDVNEIKNHLAAGGNSKLGEYVTAQEFRKKLGISNTTLWRYINEGRVRPITIGGRRLIKVSDFVGK